MFTQTDPMARAAGSPGISAYAYAANNPLVYTDPSGLREAVAPLQPIKDAGKESAPEWLLKKARDTVKTAWNTPFAAPTTGYCGDLSIDFVISLEAQGCFVDDGNRLGSVEFFAAGAGTPNVSATGELLLSNARNIRDLGGLGVCVGVGAGVAISFSGEVCWGLNAQTPLSSLVPSMLSTTFVLNGGAGVGLLPLAAGHVVFGRTFVQEIWNYPRVVDWVCGRVISNPLKGDVFPPICPSLNPFQR